MANERSITREGRIRDLEKDLIETMSVSKVSDIPELPFNSLKDVKTALKNKKLQIAVEYDADNMEYYSTRSQYFIHSTLIFTPYIFMILSTTVAILTKQWVILIGIPLAFLGQLSSSPYFKIRGTVSGLGGMILVITLFLGWQWVIISGSLFFPLFFTMIAREQYTHLMNDIAFRSEIIFCYFVLKKYIRIRVKR